MKFFDLDSPVMQVLGKVADMLLLNVLALVCCIPLVTIGASLTALHSVSLKMARNEECYITRGFFKAFKENFRQSTLIWLLLLGVILIIAGDFYIIRSSGLEINQVIQIIIMIVSVFVAFTSIFLFPVQARFHNTIFRTIKNAFVMSILQFPKTILMILLNLAPAALLVFVPEMTPLVFLFGLSVPAFLSAMLYNKFFKRLENQVLEADGENAQDASAEDERIFRDELDQALAEK
ncbi:MAG: DUF624 domain-containing protein [Clostridium sp.]|jgi:uncharacterized membrane protein YesL|nr:DUF624 domain-containing protein [Clostridium sp.]